MDQVLALPEGSKIQILAPVVRARKGEYAKVFEDARRSGYVRVRVDGSLYDLGEEIKLEKNKKHNIEIIVDRLVVKREINQRLTDSHRNRCSALRRPRHCQCAWGRRAGSAVFSELRLSKTAAFPSKS